MKAVERLPPETPHDAALTRASWSSRPKAMAGQQRRHWLTIDEGAQRGIHDGGIRVRVCFFGNVVRQPERPRKLVDEHTRSLIGPAPRQRQYGRALYRVI